MNGYFINTQVVLIQVIFSCKYTQIVLICPTFHVTVQYTQIVLICPTFSCNSRVHTDSSNTSNIFM